MLMFGAVYVYLFIPETKGLSLEEVDEMYRSGVKPWNSSTWKPAEKHLPINEGKRRNTNASDIGEKQTMEMTDA
jgi:MFS transporter, SP family, sugar:H+ symporter